MTKKKYPLSQGSKHITAIRVEEVLGLMVKATPTHEIIRLMRGKYEVTESTVFRWLQKARKDVLKMYQTKKEEHLADTLLIRAELISKMVEQGGYAAASQAVADRDKLIGMYEQTDAQDINITLKIK